MIPKVALKHLVSIQSGHSPSTFQLADAGQFPYVKVEDMNNCQKYQFESREYTNDSSRIVPKGAVIFPKRGAAIMNNKVRVAATDLCMDTNMMANRVHNGDIVYTKSPTGDFPLGIIKQSSSQKDAIVSPLYGVFTPKTFNLGVVIDFYFSSPARAKNYLFPIVQKGAKNTIAITNNTFLSASLNLPIEESVQKVIAEYVLVSRKEIDLLKKLAEKQKLQKRGLMQKLLTGEWRVKVEACHD